MNTLKTDGLYPIHLRLPLFIGQFLMGSNFMAISSGIWVYEFSDSVGGA